jgi:predicted deacetylase
LPRQLDDVNPQIACESSLIDKSETLMVIPLYQNKSIAENRSWCEYLLSLNKTLAMHGVYHTYNEFYTPRDEQYILAGMEEFKKCFGFYPSIFEAPQVALNNSNEVLLKQMGFDVRGYPFQLTHKVYHCSDTGKYSNNFVDWI